MSIVSHSGQNIEECHKSHFLTCPTKKVDVYKDTGLKGWLFIFLPVLQSTSWCGAHSTAIHLCAMGFIYTLQTFIRLIWLRKRGEREEGKNAYENAAAVRGQYSQNKKDALQDVSYNNIHVIQKVTTEVSRKTYGKFFSKMHRDRKRPIIILHPACYFSQMKK